MNQLATMQMNPICAPHIMLHIFTQLQAFQAESSTIWKHCNVTIEDLTKQVSKCHRERKRWREMEQELLDEKDALQTKFLNALEKHTELEDFLKQHKEFAEQKDELLNKIKNEMQNTLKELNKYKDVAKNKEEEVRKANKYMQEITQELNAGREQSELCNILADIAIESEGNEYSPKTLVANSTVRKLLQATEAVKSLKNLKNEMNNTSNNLEAVVNERDQLKKVLDQLKNVLQERESTLSRMTEEKTLLSKELNIKESKITSLSEEKQQLQHQLQEEKSKSSSLQQELREQKTKCSIVMEVHDILKGRTHNEALLDAATGNNVREMEVLLNTGADIEASDDKKRTALILAAMKGHIEACRFLINRGAKLEARATGWYNNTPFLAAVIYSNKLDAVKYLVDAGANMYAKDSLGYTAFQKDAINESIRQWLKTKG